MIKRLLFGICVVLCAIAVLGVLFISNLDLNLHREKIQQAVFDKTGRKLSINGGISASVFPWIGLQLQDVSLANAEGFGAEPFARVRSSDVKLELLPLITGTLNVDLLQLDGLFLNLHIDADGVANWEDLLTTTTVVETETAEDDVLQAVEAGAPLAAALSVGGIVITDAIVAWLNDKTGSDLIIDQWDLNTDAIQLGKPFDISTQFSAGSNSSGLISDVQASGALDLDLASNTYTLNGLQLSTVTSGRGLPKESIDAGISGDLLVNLNAQTFDMTNVSAQIAEVPFHGELHGTGLLASANLYGVLTSDEFNAVELLQRFDFDLPASIDHSLLDGVTVDLAFQKSPQQLLINQLNFSADELKLGGNLQIANLEQSPVLSGQLASNTFDPAPWLASFGISAADPLVMQSASVAMDVRQSGQLLSFNDIKIALDGFDLSGNVEMTDIFANVSPLVFELHGTALDVDRYRTVEELSEAGQNTSHSKDTPLPVDALRSQSVHGELTLDALTYAGIRLTDIVLPVRADEGKVEVSEAKASLYDGSLFSSLTLDLNSDEPLLTLSSNVSAVQSAPLLSDYLKSESPVSGSGILNVDMLTRGVTTADWLQQADGALSLRFTDGALHGVNIGRELRRANALLNGGDVVGEGESWQTDFTELSISAEINDGVMLSDDLTLKSPLLRVSGEGSLDLVRQQVDYLARVQVSATEQGQGGDEMSALTGLTLPVPIRGTFNELSVNFADTVAHSIKSDFSARLDEYKADLLAKETDKAEAEIEKREAQLQQKLDQQKEAVEVLIEEKQEVLIEEVKESGADLNRQLEDRQQALQNKLEKGLSNLLEK